MSVQKFFTLFLFLSGHMLSAVSPDFSKPQTFLQFADSLADDGDYYRAITEYKKVLHYFPEYKKNPWVTFQIGKMYYLGGRYTQAKDYLVPLTENTDENLNFLAHNYIALSYFENNEFGNARRLFSELAIHKMGENHSLDYRIYMLMATLSNKDFKEAQEVHKALAKTEKSEYKEFFKKTEEKLKIAADLSPKSPGWAVFWGIVFPGGGHLYLKHWDTALVTFTLVGATAFLAYDGFVRESNVQAGVFLTLSTGLYIGSLYSAYRSTGKYNAELGDKEIREIQADFRRLNISISHKISF